MATIVLVLILYLPDQRPVIYEDKNIGTLGACFAVAQAYLNRAIEIPRDTPARYDATCVVRTEKAMNG